jgi:hypothetical protein
MNRSTIALSMSYAFIAISVCLLFSASTYAGGLDTLHSNIVSKAQQSKNGVIVAVTDRGDIAASTAWLLCGQVQQNSDYAPLLMVLKPEDRVNTMKSLGLHTAELPALIYFDKKGMEINRVIGVAPSAVQSKKHMIDVASIN